MGWNGFFDKCADLIPSKSLVLGDIFVLHLMIRGEKLPPLLGYVWKHCVASSVRQYSAPKERGTNATVDLWGFFEPRIHGVLFFASLPLYLLKIVNPVSCVEVSLPPRLGFGQLLSTKASPRSTTTNSTLLFNTCTCISKGSTCVWIINNFGSHLNLPSFYFKQWENS